MVRPIRVLPILALSSRSHRRWWRYKRETRRPLTSLIFLMPPALLYEMGGVMATRPSDTAGELLAPSVIENLLAWIGLAGSWLPPLVLLAALLVWHHLRRDRWRVRWWVFPGMVAECLTLAVPLLVLSALFEAPRPTHCLQALGAAVYEELVFRLFLISGLVWLLADAVGLRRPAALGLAVMLAALIFSLCHFAPVGADPPGWKPFWLRLTAGIYLSAIFVRRGLGLSGGAHAAYNLLLGSLSRAGGT